jgi:hypothetical protein
MPDLIFYFIFARILFANCFGLRNYEALLIWQVNLEAKKKLNTHPSPSTLGIVVLPDGVGLGAAAPEGRYPGAQAAHLPLAQEPEAIRDLVVSFQQLVPDVPVERRVPGQAPSF